MTWRYPRTARLGPVDNDRVVASGETVVTPRERISRMIQSQCGPVRHIPGSQDAV